MSPRSRIGLVGCVKSKQSQPTPAADLYTSPLFVGRRRYVEKSCDQWYVLSAKYGLVLPTDVLEPYDVTLKTASRVARRAWSRDVVRTLHAYGVCFDETVFEIHAGEEYRAFGLVEALIAGGGRVDVPTNGLSLGRQLGFYNKSNARK